MVKGVCVFDLDNTLGDFRAVDFFGYIFEPKLTINSDDKSLYDFRNRFENYLNDVKITERFIFRPNIIKILQPLVDAYKSKKIIGFYIYSNNNNPYALEYAQRYLENEYSLFNLFKFLLHRSHPLRERDFKFSQEMPPKLVQTILDLIPEEDKPNIIFFDDLEHKDFRSKNVTYVKVIPFESKATTEDLEDIWKLFLIAYEEMNIDIFDLPHIKHLGYRNLKDIHNAYIEYSNTTMAYRGFTENSTYIDNLIQHFLKPIVNTGGKYRNYTKRYKKNRSKKRRYLLKHERSNSIDV